MAACDTIWRVTSENDDPDRQLNAIIKKLYSDINCAIIASGQLTDWFPVNIGVIQGIIMSSSLFNLFLELVYSLKE